MKKIRLSEIVGELQKRGKYKTVANLCRILGKPNPTTLRVKKKCRLTSDHSVWPGEQLDVYWYKKHSNTVRVLEAGGDME